MSDYGSDYDKESWQAEQAARDAAQEAYRNKMSEARARSAANAKRKIARLHAKLTELGHISDFEDEFGESVLERLDKYGSAFRDREKGRAGDALSIAQKQVVARMKKKLKELKAKQALGEGLEIDPDADYVRTADRWKNQKFNKGGFKSKRKSGFAPRVRNIEDELLEDVPQPRPVNPGLPKLISVVERPEWKKQDAPKKRDAPYIPKYTPAPPSQSRSAQKPVTSGAKRPFLRIVPKAVDEKSE